MRGNAPSEPRWQRKWNWEDGLAETVEWYRRNEAWWRSAKQRLEFRQHETRWYKGREKA